MAITPTKLKPILLEETLSNFSFHAYNPIEKKFEKHTLVDLLTEDQWLVLFFYPADFTFVCPTELADIAQYQKEFDRLGVRIVTFSTDSHFSHLAWHSAEKLLEEVPFLMGSDPTGELARYFGVYNHIDGTAERGTFIITPKGALISSEINASNIGRNATELLRKLQANVYVWNNPGQVCPAGWEQNTPALTPSEDLVGNVAKHYESK